MSTFDLYFVFWVPMMIIGVGLLPVTSAFLKRLKAKHPSAWVALGEPTMFYNSSIKNQRAVRRFIRANSHLALHDPALNKLAIVLKWGGRVGLGLFLGCVVLLLLTFGKH